MVLPDTFDEYAGAFATKRMDQLKKLIDGGHAAPALDHFVLRVIWLHETNQVTYPDGIIGDIGRSLVLKLVHESRSLLGSTYWGSSFGALHHLRGVLETWACLHYVFSDSKKTPQRLQRWGQFADVNRYAHRKRLERSLAAGEITQAEFDRRCLVPPAATAVTPEEVRAWEKLYTKKPAEEIRSWMQGKNFEDLLEEIDQRREFHLGLARSYATACHATHPSPQARWMLATPLSLLDFTPQNADLACMLTLQAWLGAFALLPEPVGATLLANTKEEVAIFAQLAKDLLPDAQVLR